MDLARTSCILEKQEDDDDVALLAALQWQDGRVVALVTIKAVEESRTTARPVHCWKMVAAMTSRSRQDQPLKAFKRPAEEMTSDKPVVHPYEWNVNS